MPLRRAATLSASTQSSSNIIVAPVSAVSPLGSSGGETSTRSAPTISSPRSPRTSACASRVVMPPISGVPVPGAKDGSIASMSNET